MYFDKLPNPLYKEVTAMVHSVWRLLPTHITIGARESTSATAVVACQAVFTRAAIVTRIALAVIDVYEGNASIQLRWLGVNIREYFYDYDTIVIVVLS